MKQVNTVLSTGTKLTIPNSSLIGTVMTYKQGKIKVCWSINGTSGISEELPTIEWNRRLKAGTIIVSN